MEVSYERLLLGEFFLANGDYVARRMGGHRFQSYLLLVTEVQQTMADIGRLLLAEIGRCAGKYRRICSEVQVSSLDVFFQSKQSGFG